MEQRLLIIPTLPLSALLMMMVSNNSHNPVCLCSHLVMTATHIMFLVLGLNTRWKKIPFNVTHALISPPVIVHSLRLTFFPNAAYSVTVGFEQTAYTVDEVDDYQLVCFKVLSGNLASRELTFDYTTTSGTASMSM